MTVTTKANVKKKRAPEPAFPAVEYKHLLLSSFQAKTFVHAQREALHSISPLLLHACI